MPCMGVVHVCMGGAAGDVVVMQCYNSLIGVVVVDGKTTASPQHHPQHHPCTLAPMHHTHSPIHARPGLPVNQNPNPTPAEEDILELHYTAAIPINFKLVLGTKCPLCNVWFHDF